MLIELKTVPNAALDVADDGTATLTVKYFGIELGFDARLTATHDLIAATSELAEYVIVDRPDICGMGHDVWLTVRFRRSTPITFVVNSPGVFDAEGARGLVRDTLTEMASRDRLPEFLRSEAPAVESIPTTPVDPDPAA